MVITPMLQKGVAVELAKTTNPTDMEEADRDDAVLLAVTRDGKFYLAKDQIDIEELSFLVSGMLEMRLDKTVYVKSDARARYGDLVTVVDTLREAGVDKIGLLTERLDDKIRQ